MLVEFINLKLLQNTNAKIIAKINTFCIHCCRRFWIHHSWKHTQIHQLMHMWIVFCIDYWICSQWMQKLIQWWKQMNFLGWIYVWFCSDQNNYEPINQYKACIGVWFYKKLWMINTTSIPWIIHLLCICSCMIFCIHMYSWMFL